MEILLWLLIWLVKGVLAVAILLLIAIALFIQWFQDFVLKLQTGLPWLKWLTLHHVVQMGYSEFWSRPALTGLYKSGQLEIRQLEDITDIDQRMTDILGFHATTVHAYEFKLTKSGGRKKLKFKELIPALRPALVPVRKSPA